MSTQLDVYLLGEVKRGWGPIWKMGELAAQSLDAHLITVPERCSYGRAFGMRGLLAAPRRKNGRHALVIAGVPGQLRVALQRPLWLAGYESVNAWVIDSFWDDRVPTLLHERPHFDRVWVADEEDVLGWEKLFPGRVGVLPWGTDALGASRAMARHPVVRDFDVLRVGRQPAAFDDDVSVAAVVQEAGLSFHGRPPFGETPEDGQRILESYLMRARTILAFTNLVDETIYTHPTKEYVTGRWTDALAFGAIPAGKRPNTATSRLLVPDHLSLEIDYHDTARAAAQLQAYLHDSQFSTLAEQAMAHARRVLDWRHRFVALGAELGLPVSERLRTDLDKLAEF